MLPNLHTSNLSCQNVIGTPTVILQIRNTTRNTLPGTLAPWVLASRNTCPMANWYPRLRKLGFPGLHSFKYRRCYKCSHLPLCNWSKCLMQFDMLQTRKLLYFHGCAYFGKSSRELYMFDVIPKPGTPYTGCVARNGHWSGNTWYLDG